MEVPIRVICEQLKFDKVVKFVSFTSADLDTALNLPAGSVATFGTTFVTSDARKDLKAADYKDFNQARILALQNMHPAYPISVKVSFQIRFFASWHSKTSTAPTGPLEHDCTTLTHNPQEIKAIIIKKMAVKNGKKLPEFKKMEIHVRGSNGLVPIVESWPDVEYQLKCETHPTMKNRLNLFIMPPTDGPSAKFSRADASASSSSSRSATASVSSKLTKVVLSEFGSLAPSISSSASSALPSNPPGVPAPKPAALSQNAGEDEEFHDIDTASLLDASALMEKEEEDDGMETKSSSLSRAN